MPVHKKLNCKKNDCISDYEKNTLKIKCTFWNHNANKIHICREKPVTH